MTINEREIVLDMLLTVSAGNGYSHRVLQDTLTKYQYLPKNVRGFITRLFEGTLEYRYQIDWELDYFSKVPVKKMKPVIRELLRMGVYQLLYMEVPDSAACNEAVKLAKKRGFVSLTGYVNGVLRSIAREKEALPCPDRLTEPAMYLAWKYSMPEWLVKEWLERFGEADTEQMLAAMLEERPVTVRINSRITPKEFDSRLKGEGVITEPGNFLANSRKLSSFDYLNSLESFREGLFQVQDESSMLAVLATGAKSGQNVLEVCAAPGGKSLFLSELVGSEGHVTARDLTEYKVNLIIENAKRYGCNNLTAESKDARVLDESFVGCADVVLADLPCSGLGVMGRKRDIKYRITEKDREELALLQRQILEVVKQYVKPGGVLVYSTCTISTKENEENVAWMLENWDDFVLEPLFSQEQFLDAPNPQAASKLYAEGEKGYLQLCPGQYPTDGFFIAKLRRK